MCSHNFTQPKAGECYSTSRPLEAVFARVVKSKAQHPEEEEILPFTAVAMRQVARMFSD